MPNAQSGTWHDNILVQTDYDFIRQLFDQLNSGYNRLRTAGAWIAG